MATLKSQMVSDAANVLLNTSEHAENVWLWPSSNRSAARQVLAIVHQDALEGSRESPGDGRRLNNADGYALRESVVLDVLATAGIKDEQDPRKPDVFLVNGEAFAAKRVLGRDSGMVTVLCVRVQRQLSRIKALSG